MNVAATYLACDVGGTRIKIGVVRDGRILARTEIEARASTGFAGALQRIVRAGRSCCRQASVDPRSLAGFGLSFPGIIEPGTERILSAPAGKFDDARSFDVAGWFRGALGIPARICNDANAALAGEWRHGAARGRRSVVMVTLGTGIGTSAVIEGVPLRGAHGQAGCLGGHFDADPAGRPCPCGNVGCAETLASTWALPALAKAEPGFATSRLARAGVLDYAAVFAAASRGDAVAVRLRDRAIRVWSGVVVSLIHAYDPECVVIGGGILRSRTVILPRVRRHVARHAWTPCGTPDLRAARLGDDAALLGMATLFEARS